MAALWHTVPKRRRHRAARPHEGEGGRNRAPLAGRTGRNEARAPTTQQLDALLAQLSAADRARVEVMPCLPGACFAHAAAGGCPESRCRFSHVGAAGSKAAAAASMKTRLAARSASRPRVSSPAPASRSERPKPKSEQALAWGAGSLAEFLRGPPPQQQSQATQQQQQPQATPQQQEPGQQQQQQQKEPRKKTARQEGDQHAPPPPPNDADDDGAPGPDGRKKRAPQQPQPAQAAAPTREQVERARLVISAWGARAVLDAHDAAAGLAERFRQEVATLVANFSAAQASAISRGDRGLLPTFCGEPGCSFVGPLAAVCAHERAKHGDDVGLLAARRRPTQGLPNTGSSCSVSAVVAAVAALGDRAPLGGAPAALTAALSAPSVLTARALVQFLGVRLPAAPASVMDALLLSWHPMKNATHQRRTFVCKICAATGAAPEERHPVMYLARAGGETAPATTAMLHALLPAAALADCPGCGSEGRLSLMPGEFWMVETPFGGPTPATVNTPAGLYDLAAVVVESPPGHAATMVPKTVGKTSWALLDDGAFVAPVPPPVLSCVRLLVFLRAERGAQAAPPATTPPLDEMRVRRPLGGKPGAGKHSWAFVALIAAAVSRHGVTSSRCVATLSVPLFSAAAAEIAEHLLALPTALQWGTNVNGPYLNADTQEHIIEAVTSVHTHGALAASLVLLRDRPAAPQGSLVDPVRAAVADEVSADLTGTVYSVVEISPCAGFVTLATDRSRHSRIPASAVCVIKASRARISRSAPIAPPRPASRHAPSAHDESPSSSSQASTDGAPRRNDSAAVSTSCSSSEHSGSASSDGDDDDDPSTPHPQRAPSRNGASTATPRARLRPPPPPARPACTCHKPPGIQGRHHRYCAISVYRAAAKLGVIANSYSGVPARVSHLNRDAQPQPPPVPVDPGFVPFAPALGVPPAPRPAPAYPPLSLMPPIREVLAARVALHDSIPQAARQAFASALVHVLADCSHDDAPGAAWERLFCFPRAVLVRLPRTAGSPSATIRDRCRRFTAHGFAAAGDLTREAMAIGSEGRPGSENAARELEALLTEEFESQACPGLGTDTDGAAPSEAVIRCALAQARKGYASRATATLQTAKVADPANPATADAMRALHPPSADPEGTRAAAAAALLCSAQAPSFSERQARGVVRGFPLGSSAGPSGLAPKHIADACAFSGSLVPGAVATFCTRTAAGKVPSAWRPFIFGARSMALEKKGGGLRPLAAGETLRRITGKLLMRHVARDSGVWFLQRQQVAVAVAGGADAAALAMRLFAARVEHDADPKVALKVDMRNAFNCISRTAIIEGAMASAPALAPFFGCAYGQPSFLFLGEGVLVSGEGVHQGCPLSPPGFSLGVTHTRTNIARFLALSQMPPSPAVILLPAAPPAAATTTRVLIDDDDADSNAIPHAPSSPGMGEDAQASPHPSLLPPGAAPPRPPDPRALGIGCLPGLLAEAWFLDDAAFGGKVAAVAQTLAALELELARIGLTLNRGKCELFAPAHLCADAAFVSSCAVLFAAIPPPMPLDTLTLLGVPCGSAAEAAAEAARVAVRATRRAARIAALKDDPHVATTLLRLTAGFCLGVHLVRARGNDVLTACESIDASVLKAWEDINFELSPSERDLFFLPASLGGLGFRSLARAASAANCASIQAASITACRLYPEAALASFPSHPSPLSTARAAALAAVISSLPAAAILATDLMSAPTAVPFAQRRLCRADDVARGAAILAAAPSVQRARIQSASVAGSNFWLAPPAGVEDVPWLSPEEFTVLLRLRMMRPIFVGEGPHRCGNCGAVVADPYGHHSLTCSTGGHKQRIHNAMRSFVTRLAADALWSPMVEPACFAQGRPDILFRLSNGPTRILIAVDVSVVSPLAVAAIARAAAEPAGAAEDMARVKHRTYDEQATSAGCSLVPMVVDCFGAMCKEGTAALSRLAAAWGRRLELHRSRSTLMVAARFNVSLMQSVARMLLASAVYQSSHAA